MNHQQLLMPLVSLFENLRPATQIELKVSRFPFQGPGITNVTFLTDMPLWPSHCWSLLLHTLRNRNETDRVFIGSPIARREIVQIAGVVQDSCLSFQSISYTAHRNSPLPSAFLLNSYTVRRDER